MTAKVRFWLRVTGLSWHEVDEATYNQLYQATSFTQDQTGPVSLGFKAPGIEGCYTLLDNAPVGPTCRPASDQVVEQPTVHPKAEYQKDDCLTPDCEHPSSLEVRLPLPDQLYGLIQIRCCDQPQCIANATQLALMSRIAYDSSILARI